MAIVHLPSPFINITTTPTLTVEADTVLVLIKSLAASYPMLREYLLTNTQTLTPFINIYVNDQDIRTLALENTALCQDDIVTLVPALAGG